MKFNLGETSEHVLQAIQLRSKVVLVILSLLFWGIGSLSWLASTSAFSNLARLVFAPAISSISPSTPTASSSDQNVTVFGSGFQSGLTVTVTFPGGGTGTLSGTQIQNVTSTSFVMVITLNSTGTWGIRVNNPGGGGQSNTFFFTVQAASPPSISSISPSSPIVSSSNQNVTVFGNNFQSGLTVSVTFPGGGGTTLSGSQIQSVTSTSFVMVVTLNGAGTWSIRVNNPNGLQSNTFSFTVQLAQPSISSISPSSPVASSSNQNVTVFGNNFQSGLTVSVTFPGGGGTTLSGSQIQSVTSSSFLMVITLNSAGTWSIRVNNPSGSQSNTFNFTVQPAQPTISSINPASPVASSSNQNVTVSGTNFQSGLTVAVTFPGGGGTTLSGSQIQSVTSSSFIMVITMNSAGTWSIRVNNPDGGQSNTFSFTVQATPSIISISPSSPIASSSNQNVTVNGSNFQSGLTVSVTFPGGGGTTLSGSQIQNVTSSSFVMVITLNSAGTWSIRVNNPNGGQSNTFSFTVQAAPSIASISPTSPIASGNNQNITVNGSGFQAGLTVSVTFPGGGGTTLSGSQIQSVTSTSFVMVITLNAAGTWGVRVNNPNGGQSNTFSFTVQAAPSITSISPTSPVASGNNQNVTVSGSDFQAGLTVSVTFPGGGGTTLSGSQIQNVTTTSFVMVITLNAAGTWSIKVNNPNGGQSNTFSFTVQAAPSITSISPTSPVANGNNQNVTVNGSGFQAGLTVSVTFPGGGGTTLSGSQIQNVTSSSFVMVITLNAAGTWSIRVNNSNGGQSNTFSFTVQPAQPTISSISPTSPVASSSNQNVTVSGTNFQSGLTVSVTFPGGGGTTLSGSQIQSVTSTSFVMVITLNSAGTWSIRVNNPDGGQSNTFSFTVQAAPTITSISPSTPVVSINNQNVIVNGSGFQAGLTVSVTFPGGGGATLSGTQIQNVTASSFVMVITLNGAGTWCIRVNNPNGGQSNTFCFIVQAPVPPSISSISPGSPTVSSNNQNVTVNGSNFQSGLTVSITFPGGGGTILSGTQIQSVTSSSFVMVATLSALGTWSIRVNNPDGGQSNIFSFTVLSQQSAPFIASVSPASPTASANNQNVSVFGSNFQPNLTVTVTFPNGQSTMLSGTQIQSVTASSFVMVITLSAAGAWSIRVNNPDGGQSNTFSFTVLPTASVTISSISPTTPIRSSIDQPIIVNGSSFQPNLTVNVTFPSGGSTMLSGTQITGVTANSFTMLITLSATGLWRIQVNNPNSGGQSNVFSFNVQSGPSISSISPVSPVMSSTDQNVTVNGTNFQTGLTVGVTFPNGQSLTLSGTQIQGVTSSSFVMRITLGSTGNWTIKVNINGVQSNPFSFTVRAPALTITNITPITVTAGLTTTLTVVGSNFQNNFSAFVTTQDGTFQIASTGLFFDSSSQVRVQVKMFGTPPYQATLKITNPDLQSATSTFSVSGGTPSTRVLTGSIRLRDAHYPDLWKLDGVRIDTIDVWAIQISDGSRRNATWNRQEGTYTFPDIPSGVYELHLNIQYKDEVVINNSSVGNWGCENTLITKVTHYSETVDTSNVINWPLRLPPPIVMVHGITSCWRKWYCDQGICEADEQQYNSDEFWANYAANHGFLVFTPNYHSGLATSWPERATEIKNQVEYNLKGLSHDANDLRLPPWFYVAHSMGGLVGRVLTSGQHKDSTLVKSLQKLYLLGTPNSGTDLRGRLSEFGGLSEGDIRGVFNQTDGRKSSFPSFGGKSVQVYAGTNGGRSDTSNDGEVPVNSVHNIYKATCLQSSQYGWFCGKSKLVMALDRLPETGQRYDHTGLGSPTSRHELLIQRILPDICNLSGMSCDSLPSSAAEIARTATEALPSAVLLQNIATTTKSIAANQIDNWSFNVSSTDLLKINVTYLSGAAGFSLFSPSGQPVDFSTLPQSSGERVTSQLGESFILNNPVAGLWTLRTTAGATGINFSAVSLENSIVGFEGYSVTPTLSLGQPTLLIGQWAGNLAGTTTLSVSARITDELGNIVTNVSLFDDGAHQDGAAGDGVFGGDTPIFSSSGRYTVTFTAQGTYSGQAFTRWAEATVDVVTSTHLFTGSFGDVAVDSDTNGTYDTLRSVIGVFAPVAGSYLVTADLQDAQGYYLDHAVGYLQINVAGMYSVNLDFRLTGAVCSQYGAPFTIKNLTLSDASSLKALDVYTDNVTTQTYSGSLFGCTVGTPASVAVSVQPSSLFPGASGQVIINGSSFADGAQVSFGSGVTVSSVTYGESTTLLAQVSVAAGATTGLRDVTVTNPDGRSSTATGLFAVASDQPPTVAISNLSGQQNLSGTVTVSASANDDVGIQRVEFYLDNTLANTDTSFPYQFVWNTSTSSNGAHTVLVKAFDTTGQMTTAQATVNAGCSFSLPLASQSFPVSGGNGAVNINTTSVCVWAAVSNVSWITINGNASGSGNGSVSYTVGANPGAARMGTITIAGQTFTVTQSGCSAIAIGPSMLPAGTANSAYAPITFTPTGGTSPYSCGVSAGNLPNGLAINGCVLSGTPTQSGSFPLTVKATDSNGCMGTASYTLTINCQTITVTAPATNTGTAGTAFNQSFTQVDGIGTTTFSTASTLPTGITLSTAGLLTGTPTQTGNFPLTVKATDSNGCMGTVSYTLTINCPTITVTAPATNIGTANAAFSQNFTQGGGIGTTTFNTVSALPTGVTLSSAGLLAGTPTQTDTFPLTVKATDSNGCMGTVSYTLTINCQTITVPAPATNTGIAGAAFSQGFTQAGGIGTTTFSTVSALPTGITLSTAGLLSGTPTQTGSFPLAVKATDSNGCMGTVSYTLTINCPTITVTAPTTNTGTVGTAFSQTFTQTGGIGTTTFSTASTLPMGLSLSVAGVLSGTPTQPGTFPLTVKATDSNNCMGTASYMLTISCQTIIVTAPATNTGTAGTPFSQSFTQAGGSGTTTFNTVSALPTGVTLSAAGLLAGTPAQTGIFPLTVKATDSNGCMGTVSYTLTINCPTIVVNPTNTTLPTGRAGTAYNQTFTQTGGIGVVNFSISAGTLPAGLTLSVGGVLSGTPTVSGLFNFTIKATDTNACFGERAYSLTVNPACGTITVNPSPLANGFLGTAYNQTLTATGGTAPYTFAVTTGSLPNGLMLASGGALTGTPTAAGTFSFTVSATDNTGCTGTRSYAVIVSGNGLQFYPLASPVRLLDTRAGQVACSQPNAPILGQTSLTQPGRSLCGIPANAVALTGNVTTVQSGGGFLTLYPSNAAQPTVASVNYSANETINNVFTVGLGTDGAFKIFAFNTTEVVVDVTGYYAPPATGGLYFHPLSKPIRLLETRAGQLGCTTPSQPIQSGDAGTLTQQAKITCDGVTIPSAALAIVGNATTVNPQGGGFLTLFPGNATRPLVASSNYNPGQIVNGPFSVGLAPNGEFKIFTFATTDLVVDVLGYYSTEASDANGAGLLFAPLSKPVRLLETRAGQPVGCFKPGAPLNGQQEYTQTARGLCDGVTVPANALGVVGNATVVQPGGPGFLTLWPSAAATRPTVATANYNTGDVGNRHFIVGLGSGDGAFKMYSFATTNLVVDLSGYFAP